MKSKFYAILWILKARSFYLLVLDKHTAKLNSLSAGNGDLTDMVLFSSALKSEQQEFMKMIEQAATEQGELHTLNKLKEAAEIIDGGK